MMSIHEPELGRSEGGISIQDRRQARRHDLDTQTYEVERWDGVAGVPFGKLVDMSSGGMRIRTRFANLQPDQQIRLKLRLPSYAGICPFVDTTGERIKPKNEWTGWMSVNRVQETEDGDYEIGGRIVDMEPLDRGMLSLYLSMQPLA